MKRYTFQRSSGRAKKRPFSLSTFATALSTATWSTERVPRSSESSLIRQQPTDLIAKLHEFTASYPPLNVLSLTLTFLRAKKKKNRSVILMIGRSAWHLRTTNDNVENPAGRSVMHAWFVNIRFHHTTPSFRIRPRHHR